MSLITPPTLIYLWSNSQPRPLFPFLSLFLILSVCRQGLPVRGVEDILEAHRRPADVNLNRGSKTCVRVYLVLRACVFPCTNTHGCVHMCVFLKRGDQLWARGLGETRRAGIMGNETKSNIWKKEEAKDKKKPHFCLLFISVCAKVPKVKRAWEIHKGQTAHAKQWNTIFIYFSFFDMHSIKSTTVIIVSFLSCSLLSLLFMSIYPTACCMIIISGKQKMDYMPNTFWRASYCFNYPSVNSALHYTVYSLLHQNTSFLQYSC